jgi:SAM-dependent methyltransferase
MRLPDIVERAQPPLPWAEGEKIPWSDPAFSRRMLREHLSQTHDAASRRAGTIDQQVAWIHEALLGGRPSRVLDLGCGPGLYTSRLARLGHECVGIDFSPASIAHARAEAKAAGLRCRYVEQDIRTADYGSEYDLAMLLFGELNVFRPAEAEGLLRKMHAALSPGGAVLLEPHTGSAVRRLGHEAPTWYSAAEGLFSDRPHLCLTESSWNEELSVATERYFIVDAESGEVTRHASSMQAYSDEQYRALLTGCGLTNIAFRPSPGGEWGEMAAGLMAITARRP